MKRSYVIVAIVAVVAAYVAGYWPQRQRLADAQARLAVQAAQVTAAEGRVRLAELLGRLLRLTDAVTARNYGDAAQLSSAFYDLVGQEAGRADRPEVGAALTAILQTRDQVTSMIGAMAPELDAQLVEQTRALRRALGYAVPVPVQ